MWQTIKSNLICGYLEAYENQKKHIERVISAKEITKNKIPPYYPKFLKLKVYKNYIEETKNDKLKEENKMYFYKINKAKEKSSQYSRINEPKKCPAFDKDLIYFKRINNEIKNYKENVRFYNKIGNISSYYNHEEFKERNKLLDDNSKLLQKSIFDISPSLFFLSPSRIKKEVEKYKNSNIIRSKSTIIKKRPKSGIPSHYNSSKKIRSRENRSIEKNEVSLNDGILGPIQEDEEEKNKGNDNNHNNYKNNNSETNNLNKKNNIGVDNKSSDTKKTKKKIINKKKRPKSALRRNESEVNLLN